MDPATEQVQLYEIERFDTSEAIDIVRFSTSRSDCKNLIINGDHKRKPKAVGVGQPNGRKRSNIDD